MNRRRNLILVTTTRADWGILTPLARALASRDDISLTIAAGNMHLSEQFGHTIDEIERAGFDNIVRLDPGDTTTATAIAAGTMAAMGRLIAERRPDGVIVLGDRFEILGVVSAALIADVPVVHLHGGEISEGAIDDAVRHAVSKMASLHLVATEQSARRLARMGEEPRRIVLTGAIGTENAVNHPVMDLAELSRSLGGFDVDPSRTLLVTYHPVTRDAATNDGVEQTEALLGAIDDNPRANAIITYPNNDPGGEAIVDRLRRYASSRPGRIYLTPSLGMDRYLSAMHHVRAVVGNTSSGLLEAPSTQADTIDIGPRQQGRERAATVIHTEPDRAAIGAAIARLLATPRRTVADPGANPYYRRDAVGTAVDAIVRILPGLPHTKKFHAND